MTEFQFNDATLANLKDKVVIVTGWSCKELDWPMPRWFERNWPRYGRILREAWCKSR